MREPIVSRLLRLSLYVIFAAGLGVTVTLPFMLDTYMGYFYDAYYLEQGYRMFILVFLITAALPVLWIVLEMIGMLRSISNGPFVIRNVQALNRIGVILLVLALLFFIKCLVYVTFLTMACAFLFVVCGLFAFTLANLFGQAVAFKAENDLTI